MHPARTNSPILPVSSTATPTEPTDAAAEREAAREARREQDRDYYRAMLHELADMAMDLARAVHRSATQPSPEDIAQLAPASAAQTNAAAAATAFDRLARTVRRTVALARTLDDPPPAPRGPRQDGPGNARRRSRYDADRDDPDLDDPDDLDDGYDLNDDDLDNDDLDDDGDDDGDDDDGDDDVERGDSGDHLAPAEPIPAHLLPFHKPHLTEAEYYAELNRELALRPAPSDPPRHRPAAPGLTGRREPQTSVRPSPVLKRAARACRLRPCPIRPEPPSST